MAMELVSKIREAEKQAEEILADANNTARRILKDATEQSYAIVSDAEEQSAIEAKERVRRGEYEAKDEVDQMLSAARRDCGLLRDKARGAQDKAVKLIRIRLTE